MAGTTMFLRYPFAPDQGGSAMTIQESESAYSGIGSLGDISTFSTILRPLDPLSSPDASTNRSGTCSETTDDSIASIPMSAPPSAPASETESDAADVSNVSYAPPTASHSTEVSGATMMISSTTPFLTLQADVNGLGALRNEPDLCPYFVEGELKSQIVNWRNMYLQLETVCSFARGDAVRAHQANAALRAEHAASNAAAAMEMQGLESRITHMGNVQSALAAPVEQMEETLTARDLEIVALNESNEAQARELNIAAANQKAVDAQLRTLQDSIIDMARDREALDREHRDLIRQNGVLEAERRTLLKWRSAAKERHATLRAEFETADAGSQALAELYARHVELDAERVQKIAYDEETIRELETARNELDAQMETLVAENNAVTLERDAARQEATDQEAHHRRALDRSAELLHQAEAAMQQQLDQNAELASKTQADMQEQLVHFMEEKEKLGILVTNYRQAWTKCTCNNFTL